MPRGYFTLKATTSNNGERIQEKFVTNLTKATFEKSCVGATPNAPTQPVVHGSFHELSAVFAALGNAQKAVTSSQIINTDVLSENQRNCFDVADAVIRTIFQFNDLRLLQVFGETRITSSVMHSSGGMVVFFIDKPFESEFLGRRIALLSVFNIVLSRPALFENSDDADGATYPQPPLAPKSFTESAIAIPALPEAVIGKTARGVDVSSLGKIVDANAPIVAIALTKIAAETSVLQLNVFEKFALGKYAGAALESINTAIVGRRHVLSSLNVY